MAVKFERNIYYQALQSDSQWEGKEDLENEAKNRLTFEGAHVDFAQFSSQYSSKGWVKRKIVVLPMMVWSGVVKTTYHLVLVIFYGIFRWDRGRYAQAYVYCVARDVQEAFGRFVSLFNDRYGLYHIEESQFQKIIYEHYIEQHGQCYVDHDWTPVEVQTLLERDVNCGMGSCLSGYQFGNLRFDRLNVVGIHALFGLHHGNDEREIRRRIALLPQEVVQALVEREDMQYSDFGKMISDDQIRNLRFENLSSAYINAMFGLHHGNDEREIRRRVALLPQEVVQTLLEREDMQYSDFGKMISDDQIRNLRFDRLLRPGIDGVFGLRGWRDEREIWRRIALLPQAQVQALLEREDIQYSDFGKMISDDQIRNLRFDRLLRTSIYVILGLVGRNDEREIRRRIALLPQEAVQALLEREDMRYSDFGKMMSDDHWRGLKLSCLSPVTINELIGFPYGAYRCIGLISAEEVIRALESGRMHIHSYWAPFFSPAQREAIQQSRLSPAQIDELLGRRRHGEPGQSSPSIVQSPKAIFCQSLGLNAGVTKTEMRQAYLRLALQLHPDKAQQRDGESLSGFYTRRAANEARFKGISAAHTAYQDSLADSA